MFSFALCQCSFKSRQAIKEEDARQEQARRERPEADRQQGAHFPGNLLEQRQQ
jgi:hypothetical protein